METFFTAILWNAGAHLKEEILKEIPNVEQTIELLIEHSQLTDFVYRVYELDKRCSHDIVLPPKIKRLIASNEEHLLVKFNIENPSFDANNICLQAIEL